MEECSEIIDENEMISVALNDNGSLCGSCTIYIVLFVVAFSALAVHLFIFIGT